MIHLLLCHFPKECPILKTYKNLQVDLLFDSGFQDDHLLVYFLA